MFTQVVLASSADSWGVPFDQIIKEKILCLKSIPHDILVPAMASQSHSWVALKDGKEMIYCLVMGPLEDNTW